VTFTSRENKTTALHFSIVARVVGVISNFRGGEIRYLHTPTGRAVQNLIQNVVCLSVCLTSSYHRPDQENEVRNYILPPKKRPRFFGSAGVGELPVHDVMVSSFNPVTHL
jgi:hypothetical protein